MKHHVKECQVIATPGKNPTKNTKLIDRCKHDHPKQWLIPHAHRFDITAWAWHAKQDAQHAKLPKCLDICTSQNPASCNLTYAQTFHLLSFQQFRVLLTFFPKSFSHFPHGTCLLSVSTQYLALDELYHPFCAPLPRNATLKSKPYMKDCTWHTGVSPSVLLFTKSLTCTLPLALQMYLATQDLRSRLSAWAIPCSFATTEGILFSLLSSAYLYA